MIVTIIMEELDDMRDVSALSKYITTNPEYSVIELNHELTYSHPDNTQASAEIIICRRTEGDEGEEEE